MSSWIEDRTHWAYRIPGQAQDTKIQVSGVMDETQSQRPKIVLADAPDNTGPSVVSEMGATAAITSLTASMNITPLDADWFAKNDQGQLYSIGVRSEQVTMENPQFTALCLSGDFNPIDIEKAAKDFPAVQVENLRTAFVDVNPKQHQELSAAYLGARQAQGLDPNQGRELNQSPRKQAMTPTRDYEPTRDYDLSP